MRNLIIIGALLFIIFKFSGNKPTKPRQTAIYEVDTSFKKPYVDSVLRPFVLEYLQQMGSHHVDISRFYTLDSILLVPSNTRICDEETAIGCCDGKIVKVKFMSDVVFHDSSAFLKTVVYHEMGHCVLRLPHHEMQTSIMNANLDRPSWYYKQNWDYYLSEYFSYIEFIQVNPFLKILTD